MPIEGLRRAQTVRRFEPFASPLDDGPEHPAPHRDFIAVAPRAQRRFAFSHNDNAVETGDLAPAASIHASTGRPRCRTG